MKHPQTMILRLQGSLRFYGWSLRPDRLGLGVLNTRNTRAKAKEFSGR